MTLQQADLGVPAGEDRVLEVYDFRRPTTLAREHARVLELAFETFARQWGTQLTAKVRVMSQVTFEQVLMQSYDEYAASLPATTGMVLCVLEGVSAKAVIQFPTAAALSWITHMLGGSPTAPLPERKFTPIEQALIRRLMDEALEDFSYSLGPILAMPIAVDTIKYNSQFAQAAATADLMITAHFTIRVGEVTVPATVALPADAVLPQLGETNPMASADNARELLTAQLGRVPVEVSIRLAPAVVRPRAVLDLAVGDLLPMPHSRHRPMDVTVDGRRLAQAAVGTHGSRLAGIIVSTEEHSA